MLSRIPSAGRSPVAAPIPDVVPPPAPAAPMPWSSLDLAEGLHNRTDALGRAECIERVVELWKKQRANTPLKAADLNSFTRLSSNNDVQLLLDRDYFNALLPALAAATDSIHIAMLTFDGSVVGEAVGDLLIARKRANPQMQIRVIVDTWGTGSLTPWGPWPANLQRLRDAGIEVIGNNVAAVGLEHRKIVVIDGREGFFSGTCIGKEYYGSKDYWQRFEALVGKDSERAKSLFVSKYDPTQPVDSALAALDAEPDMPQYHDYGMHCHGDAVASLQAAFLQTWLLQRGEFEAGLTAQSLSSRYFPVAPPVGNTTLKVVNSVPGGVSELGTTLFELVESAEHSLDLTFPYILVPQFVEVLESAAQRGVKIRLLVPGEQGIDLPAAFFAFRHQYPRLYATGNVEIYEFKQYTHIKLMVADHRLVFASTGNPEWDSWERAFDESALFDSPALAAEIEKRVFDVDYSPEWSTHVTPAEYAKMTWWQKVRMRISRGLFDTIFRVRRMRSGASVALRGLAHARQHVEAALASEPPNS